MILWIDALCQANTTSFTIAVVCLTRCMLVPSAVDKNSFCRRQGFFPVVVYNEQIPIQIELWAYGYDLPM